MTRPEANNQPAQPPSAAQARTDDVFRFLLTLMAVWWMWTALSMTTERSANWLFGEPSAIHQYRGLSLAVAGLVVATTAAVHGLYILLRHVRLAARSRGATVAFLLNAVTYVGFRFVPELPLHPAAVASLEVVRFFGCSYMFGHLLGAILAFPIGGLVLASKWLRRLAGLDSPLVTLPGTNTRRVLRWIYHPRTMERLFDPVLADMQEEWVSAEGQPWKQRWIRLRGYVVLAQHIFLHGIVGTAKTVQMMWKTFSG